MFRAVNALVRIGLRVGRIRLVVEGRERVPDVPGVILASNHLSITDPILLDVVIEDAVRRNVRYMAKAEARSMPVLGYLLQRYGGFFVRRGQADREAYRMAHEVLDGGDWLGLAPEGTRSRTGQLGEAKPGVMLLAMRAGAMVLPVAIWGSEKLWPIGARLPRPGTTVHVRFGEPYRPAEANAARSGEAASGGEAASVGGEAAGVAHSPRGGSGAGVAHSPRGGSRAGVNDHAAAAGVTHSPGGGSGDSEAPVVALPGDVPGLPQGRGRHPGRRRDALEASTEELMEKIAALLPPEYRGRHG